MGTVLSFIRNKNLEVLVEDYDKKPVQEVDTVKMDVVQEVNFAPTKNMQNYFKNNVMLKEVEMDIGLDKKAVLEGINLEMV